jgi:hypothetical protein
MLLEWFGGAPRRVVIDSLKAAVLEANLHDPVLGEAYRRQAQLWLSDQPQPAAHA